MKYCICCGKQIGEEQYMWSRLCGYCDIGTCSRSYGFQVYDEGHGKFLNEPEEVLLEL